ncbi:MAG: alpha-glucosidase/alpha-galactosidase [Roseiflexaceae bacterium]|jgi:alpha-galactosidase
MRIVFVGAGSHIFTRRLVRDALSFPLLASATIVLHDIDTERLSHAHFGCQRIIAAGQYPAQLHATTDLVEAVTDADIVITTIAGSFDQWRHDVEIPAKYGIDLNIGDTRGPSGIFRFLRLYPVMAHIGATIAQHAPKAVWLNYTNPMAMLCGALSRTCPVPLVGLCHSVQGTAEMLARWLGAPMDEITFTCAGINHMAWYLSFEWNGVDVYPLLHQLMQNPTIYNEEIVRNELFLALGYYTTESSGHHSEYNWWFRKRPELIEQYCTPGTGWNPGASYASLKWYQTHSHKWRDDAAQERTNPTPVDLNPSNEYAAAIINALQGGAVFQFNGNVPNRGYVGNLPQSACVEVPIFVNRNGLHPVSVGDLPAPVAILTHLSSQIEELAIQGCLTGNPTLIYQACCHDPLTAARLSLAEIRALVNEMFAASQQWLPQFRHYTV